MILRPATAGDREAVVTLALHFHRATPYGGLLVVDSERVGVLFDVALQDGIIFVAELENGDEGGELVAFLGLVLLTHTLSGDRYAEEVAWWVEPAYRSGTLGPRLLARAEAWAVENGCAFLKMVAPVGTEVGLYYARRGYEPIETAFLKRVVATEVS